MKKRSAIILLFVILMSGLVAKAHAQITEQRTYTISPPSVQVNLDPGQKKEGVVKLINDGPEPLTFNVSTQDFIVKDDNGTPDILPPDTLSNKYSGADWVAIYPNTVTVQPHQKAEVQYFIQIPADARPGGHYAAVVYTPTSTLKVSGTGASVNTSIGTLFYLTVNGPVTMQAEVTKFLTHFLWDFGPVTIDSQIKNMSDIHVRPEGSVTLTNMLGQKSAVATIAQNNIFPGAQRNYQTKVGKKFMLGLYKANLKATYGPNNNVLAATTSFIVFPWKIAVFIILLIVAIVVGRKYWKKNSAKHEASNEPPSQPLA